ncbi:MAG: phasin family protein [Sphingomonadaceae bacterium]|nr:phasin family protein [Sphingomonadaceae bacterium]MBH2000341.1 phasin family protein [Sphingomonadaceae bacterium]
MAVTPKTGRGTLRAKASSTTLSASEALKAAEAAIGDAPAAPKAVAPKAATPKAAASVKPMDANPQARKITPPEAKPVTPKPVAAKPVAAKPAAVDPVAVAAATTAVDAAPEPERTPEAAPVVKAAALAPEPTPAPAAALPDPEISKTPTHGATIVKTTLPATEGTKVMNDVIETGKKFAEDAKAKMETVYADFNEKTKAGVEKSTKAIEELSDIAKGNVEALVESGKIAAKGMETLGQEAVDYGRKSFEKATASFKTFSTVKTPTEFFQLQSQLLSSSFDEFTKEAAKNSEAFMKLAGEVAQPLTARVTLVTDKVKSLAA